MTTDVSVLAGLRLTAGFPLPLRERIAERLVPQHLSGGAWLFRQGDPGSTLFLVRSGRMEIVRTTGETSRVVALMQAGDSLGELALLSGGTRSAGARAVRDCELLALHQRDVAPLLGDPDFAAAMLGSVTRMLRADPPDHDAASRRTVVAVLCEDAARGTEITGALAEAFSTEGVRCATLTAPSARLGHPPHVLPQRTGRRLDQLERTHDVVLLDAGTPDSEWGRVCARQADRVILLIGPTTPPLHDRDDQVGSAVPVASAAVRWAWCCRVGAHGRWPTWGSSRRWRTPGWWSTGSVAPRWVRSSAGWPPRGAAPQTFGRSSFASWWTTAPFVTGPSRGWPSSAVRTPN